MRSQTGRQPINSVEEAIRAHLDEFPSEFAPLSEMARKYLRYCSAVDPDGALLIAHMPWMAYLAYAFRLFPPAKRGWFRKYAKTCHLDIPSPYRPLLSTVNGCFAFGFALFGMSPSMLKNPPSLDRSKLQCLDIATANEHWKHGYASARDGFHFGGRTYSYTEDVGYFLYGKSHIVALLKDGRRTGEWDDFTSFLDDELRAAEEYACSTIQPDWWH